jgi:hypothetical protein
MRCISLALVLGLLATGCGSKKNLDESVDQLLAALAAGDHARFSAMAVPELAAKIPPPKFEVFAKITQKLGALQQRSMTGINVKTGGVRSGTYSLTFAKGTAELELTLQEGKLIAFELKGDAVKQAMRQIEEEQYATFKVASFEFQDEDKKAKNNIYKAGQVIRFTVEVYGVTIVAGEVKLKARLQVLSTDGKQLADYPSFLDTTLKAQGTARVATVSGKLPTASAKPGTYKLLLTINDVSGNQTLDYTQAFVLE